MVGLNRSGWAVVGPKVAGFTVAGAAASVALGFDIETYNEETLEGSLDPVRGKVRLVQLGLPNGTVAVFDLYEYGGDIAGLFGPLFEDMGPILVGHNLKFDLAFFESAGLQLPPGRVVFDTMLGSQLLQAAALRPPKGTHGLEAVVRKYLGVKLDKTEQRSNWGDPMLSEDQLYYAARDAAYLIPLMNTQKQQMGKRLQRVAEVEMGIVPLLAHMSVTGIQLDDVAWYDLDVEAKREADKYIDILDALAPEASKREKKRGKAEPSRCWDSPPQLLALFRARGHKIASTDSLVLNLLDDELADPLLKYRDAARKISTYGMTVLERTNRETGRIHADYLQIEAQTGRMSCIQPNMQNIPHDPRYRACFVPKPGYVLVKADYSQIELRIAAVLSGDPVMLEAYRTGIDLHKRFAAEIYDVPMAEVTKDQRQIAKSANFGLLYGAGVAAFLAYCQRNGVHITEEQATAVRERYRATFPRLLAWQREQGNRTDAPPEEEIDENETVEARIHRRLRGEASSEPLVTSLTTETMLGRIRSGVEHYTQKLNTPVQGTGADIVKLALKRLWDDRYAEPDTDVVAVVHDEILLEAPAERAKEVAAWLSGHMIAAGDEVVRNLVPIEVEVTIERNWSGAPVD